MSLDVFQAVIRDAVERGTPLRFRGGGSKDFYGLGLHGEILDTRSHSGIVDYEPSELVITARCGTALRELESVLQAQGQCLPFEPPHFGPDATVGGCVAAGLSGPRRMSAGALRDFVLGTSIVDGEGKLLHFGGKVIKNVAGYDVSRLMTGSLGTLGLIAEVSLKVLPLPQAEQSIVHDRSCPEALLALKDWARQALPVTASTWCEGRLFIRLAGAAAAVDAACRRLGGERLERESAQKFWMDIREHQHAFFQGGKALWRLALPAITPPLDLPGEQLIEWGGALRWLKTDATAATIHAVAGEAKGHAVRFRGERGGDCFMPLDPVSMRIHLNLKRSFDPAGIFNRGRMYADF